MAAGRGTSGGVGTPGAYPETRELPSSIQPDLRSAAFNPQIMGMRAVVVGILVRMF